MLETLKMSLNPIGAQLSHSAVLCCWTTLPLHRCVEHPKPQGQSYRSCCMRIAPHCVCDQGGRAIAQYVSASSLAELHLHSVGVPPPSPPPPAFCLRGHQPLRTPPPYTQEHSARVRARQPKARQRALGSQGICTGGTDSTRYCQVWRLAALAWPSSPHGTAHA